MSFNRLFYNFNLFSCYCTNLLIFFCLALNIFSIARILFLFSTLSFILCSMFMIFFAWQSCSYFSTCSSLFWVALRISLKLFFSISSLISNLLELEPLPILCNYFFRVNTFDSMVLKLLLGFNYCCIFFNCCFSYWF